VAATFDYLQCLRNDVFGTAVLQKFSLQPWKVQRYAAYESFGWTILLSNELS